MVPVLKWGQAGNLTDAQEVAYNEFKSRLGSSVSSEMQQRLLQYLRANNFDVDGAMQQWTAEASWRAAKPGRAEMLQSATPPPVCGDGGPADMLQV